MQKIVIGTGVAAVIVFSFWAFIAIPQFNSSKENLVANFTDLQSTVQDIEIAPPPPVIIEEKPVIQKQESNSVKKETAVSKAIEKPKAPEIKTPTPDEPFVFNSLWADAVVNLYCRGQYSSGSISSGSGVIIDPRGIILTNAHVGGTFLFYDTPKKDPLPLNCWVRTGLKASNQYLAKLLYIPEEYILDNVSKIGKYVPDEEIAYGKNDYALLLITNTADPNEKLPKEFPYISFETESIPLVGSSMFMIGYPASFLGSVILEQGIPRLSTAVLVNSLGSIKGSQTIDTLVFKGSIVGQHGSSGGAVIRTGGKLSALPAYFKEESSTTGESILEAITLQYIDRDLKTDTGFSLKEFIARDTPQALLKIFLTEKAPQYHKMYVDAYAKINTKGTTFIVPGGY